MIVLRAEALGMCFGVRDALEVARTLPAPHEVTLHGELVHNERVLAELDARGYHRVGEEERRGPPPTRRVLVTAHGISERERRRLHAAGAELVDTTCPLVDRVHRTARRLEAEGWTLAVLGRRDHVEVRGIVEDLVRYVVVESRGDVRCWGFRRLAVLAQTTTRPEHARTLLEAITEHNPGTEVRWVDTICQPTVDRGLALERLLDRVDALVVVGGHNSNNTRQLAERARRRGIPALHVQGPEDLDTAPFPGATVVGLTAGTSTLPETVDAVEERLRG